MTKIALISGSQDTASTNIKERLLDTGQFTQTNEKFDNNTVHALKNNHDVRLYTTNESLIHAENIDEKIPAELFIFLSKHKAAAGIPSVTVHAPGNFREALYGGKTQALCTAPAHLILRAYHALVEGAKGTRYQAIQEVTHHGPYLEKPCMFMELGSDEQAWSDKQGAQIVADAVLKVISEASSKSSSDASLIVIPAAVGIGGLHHMPNLSKLVLGKKVAIGHVAAKHVLAGLTIELVMQAMERTEPKAGLVVVDWKGCGEEKQRIREMLDNGRIKWVRSDKL